MSTTRLVRSESNKMIAGVCGGLAEYLALDPIIVRVAFVALGLASGMGGIIYLILALITPSESNVGQAPPSVKENLEQLGKTINQSFQQADRHPGAPLLVAGVMILLGIYFLLQNLGLWVDAQRIWGWLWPVLLIGLGLWVWVRRRQPEA